MFPACLLNFEITQHSLPILITDHGEKIILLYAIFTYFSSQCQKMFANFHIVGLDQLVRYSVQFYDVYGNSLHRFEVRVSFICF